MASVTIAVTADDLVAGNRHTATGDPVALAMVRAFSVPPLGFWVRGYTWPFVWARHATLPDLSLVKLPDEVWRHVEAFAQGRPVAPYEFTLDVPDHMAPKAKPLRQRRRELAVAS